MHFRQYSRRVVSACLAGVAVVFLTGCGEPSSKSRKAEQVASSSTSDGQNSTPVVAIRYPTARRGDQSDDFHGRQVADPYRWLEDTDNPETRAWIEAENKITFDFLNAIPERPAIHDRLTTLWNYERYGIPTARGDRYFYSRNDGLQNQSVLYVAASLDDEPQVLLDPNTLSADGTVALTGTAVSDDGRLLAYGLATAGSDWQEWRVRDVETQKDLEDRLQWIKFSGASWASDGKGFFYSRYDEPDEQAKLTGVNYFQKLFYHQLGTPQSADKLIYERADEKEWGFDGQVSDDGHWLVIRVWRGTERRNQLFYLDLTRPEAQVVPWITGFDAQYDFIGNDGNTFWLRTDLDAPRHRLVAADCTQPGATAGRRSFRKVRTCCNRSRWWAGGSFRFICTTPRARCDCSTPRASRRERFRFRKSAPWRWGKPGKATRRCSILSPASWPPPTIYRYDVASGKSTVFRKPKVDFAAERYTTEQVFYQSKDGTRVPMFITRTQGYKARRHEPDVSVRLWRV